MRLYVALELPAADRERIHRVTQPLRTRGLPVRWVASDAYHLTLKFLGEVAAERLSELEHAMLDALPEAPPALDPAISLRARTHILSLSLLGLGGAPSLARPRVLWIDVESSPPLMQLQSRLDSTLSELGFPSEARPFRPHITLGRIRGGKGAGDADLPALADLAEEIGLDSGVIRVAPIAGPAATPTPVATPTPAPTPTPTPNSIPIRSLALIQSRLEPSRAGYRVLSRVMVSAPEGSVPEWKATRSSGTPPP